MTISNKHVYEAELGPDSDLKTFFESSMLVTQTGFFRQDPFYNDLEKNILPSLYGQQVNKEGGLRIWSAGCSDGREPYSIGMTILRWLKAKNKPNDIKIDASDINEEQISTAIKGQYVVRISELDKMRKFGEYFSEIDQNTVVINQTLSNRINFKVEDIISKQPKNKYDLIVCTNVLLYYDKEFRKSIVESLSSSLKTGGFLYVETIGGNYLKQIGFIRLKSGSHYFQKMNIQNN